MNANSNQVDEVYKQQAALKCRVVLKEIGNRRLCALFYSWKSICTEKKFFASASHAGQNKTLYAELAKLKDKRDRATDRKAAESLNKQIKTMEKMIENDSSLREQGEVDGLEDALHLAGKKDQVMSAELEFLKDKLKKQACSSVMKIVKLLTDKAGPPGYFEHWKTVWFKRKTGAQMDAVEGDSTVSATPIGVGSDDAVRKISKLQWLVREMKQERDEMWGEMASLMASLREFETDKAALQEQLQTLGNQVGSMDEERQIITNGMANMNEKVDQYVAGA